MKVKLLSPVRLLAVPWTAAYQAPPSMGFSRQEYWSGVPLLSPEQPYKCPYISQTIYSNSTNVPVCKDGSISVELMTWEHPCILTDRSLTCVLLWVDLYMRIPRYVGIPVFIVLHRECIFSPQIVYLWQHCVKQYIGTVFLQYLLTACLCVTF